MNNTKVIVIIDDVPTDLTLEEIEDDIINLDLRMRVNRSKVLEFLQALEAEAAASVREPFFKSVKEKLNEPDNC